MLFLTRTDKSFFRLIASLSLAILWLSASPASAELNTTLNAKPVLKGEPKLPNIRFADMRGAPFKLNDIQAKVRVIHYWATWCGPCVHELPYLDKIQAQYERYGLKVIAISLDVQGSYQVTDFFAKHKISSLEPFIDQNGRDARRIGINGVPTSIFVDSKGFEITRANGPVDWENGTVQASLKQMLGIK